MSNWPVVTVSRVGQLSCSLRHLSRFLSVSILFNMDERLHLQDVNCLDIYRGERQPCMTLTFFYATLREISRASTINFDDSEIQFGEMEEHSSDHIVVNFVHVVCFHSSLLLISQ